jgi:hypothetical protein
MADSVDLLRQERILDVRYQWSTGPYLGAFLKKLKEKGEFWVAECPGCGRILNPPRIVCASCYTRVPEYPAGWRALSGKGRLLDWERVVYPQMDPETGQVRDEPYLHGTFLLDDEVLFVHYLGPADLDENGLRQGMTVGMVMKPPEERAGRVTDILYFAVLEGE